MSKFFSIFKNKGPVLGTMLVLISLAAAYVYIYTPNNEKKVQDRHFRCLQNIDRNVHNKIENSTTLIDSLLAAYKDSLTTDSLNRYIEHYPKKYFTLLPITSPGDLDRNNSVTIISDASSKAFSLYVNRKLPFSHGRSADKIESQVIKRNNGHRPDSIDLEMGIRYKIQDFIKPLLTPGVFDHFVVFYINKDDEKEKDNLKNVVVYNNTGTNDKDKDNVTNKVVYESFPSGLSYLKKDSLLQTKNGIVTPGIRTLNLSGTDYKVFTQAINVDANSEFIIAGLVSDENYQKEKDQLPSWFVLLLLTAALGAVVSLPWIKLYHMGNKDKLTVADAIASVLVSMLLMSLIFFVIFNYAPDFRHYLNPEKKQMDNPSNFLANKIAGSFEAELNTAYHTLKQYNSIHDDFDYDIVDLRQDRAHFRKIKNADGSPGQFKKLTEDSSILGNYYDTLTKLSHNNIAVKEVFWVDTSGKEKINWNTQNYNPPYGTYKDREYFKGVKKDSFNYRGTNQFYLDQVVSKTRNVFTSVIAIKLSKADTVMLPGQHFAAAVMTFTAKSLDSVIMPSGYQFAIIDKTGEVRYHSLWQRNLNESLKKEFADSSDLVSCLAAGTGASFIAAYYGKSYNITIKPFKNLPYFAVIFEDRQYVNALDTEPYAFTLSMFICFMLLVVVQHGVVFFASSRKSFFKKQFFETSWVAPNMQSHRQYNLAILANAVIVGLLLIFFCFSSFLGYLYILLFSVLLIAAFLNGLFAIKYYQAGDPRYHYKTRVLISLCILLLAINLNACITLDLPNIELLFLFQLLSLALCWVVYKWGPEIVVKIKNVIGNLLPHWNYTNSFALMVTSRLIISSGIPVAFFFVFSYNYEQNLDTRYRQLTFATDLAKKISPGDLNIQTPAFLKEQAKFRGIYPDGSHVADDIQLKHWDKNTANFTYSKEDTNTVKVLNAFRLLTNNTELRSNSLGLPPDDSTAFFNKITYLRTPERFTTQTFYKLGSGSGDYLLLHSKDINYPLGGLLWGLALTLLAALIIFYLIMLTMIRKLFALSLPPTSGWDGINEDMWANDQLNRLLLIVGPPGSGKLSKLKRMICDGKLYGNDNETACANGQEKSRRKHVLLLEDSENLPKNVFIADMILIPIDAGTTDAEWNQCKQDALSKNNALVIINHFEYNIKDSAVNKIKLDFLESLMQVGVSKIIIISTVHPLTFLDSFSDQQYSDRPAPSSDRKTAAPQNQDNKIPESELERWHVLLGHFRIIIKDLEKSDSTEDATSLLERHIFEETQYAHYLTPMRQVIINNLPVASDKEAGKISDSMAFNVQITSHYFYNYIWQSLTKEEKFILYDLAEDGLVNSYDDYNLVMLIRKGLIIRPDGVLKLFNKGFRNFILTAIGNTEVERIKEQVKDTGNWGSLKAPLTLGILSILIFLMTSQQEAFTHIIAYITTLGAGVPAILSIFSLFGRNSTPKA